MTALEMSTAAESLDEAKAKRAVELLLVLNDYSQRASAINVMETKLAEHSKSLATASQRMELEEKTKSHNEQTARLQAQLDDATMESKSQKHGERTLVTTKLICIGCFSQRSEVRNGSNEGEGRPVGCRLRQTRERREPHRPDDLRGPIRPHEALAQEAACQDAKAGIRRTGR